MSYTQILAQTPIEYPNNSVITLNIFHASTTNVSIQLFFFNANGTESSIQPIITIQPGFTNPMLLQIVITSNVLTIQTNTGPQNMYFVQFTEWDPTVSGFLNFSINGQNNGTTIFTYATLVSNEQYYVPYVAPGPNVPFPQNNEVLIACTVIGVVLLVLSYIFVVLIQYSVRKRNFQTNKKVWDK